MDNPESNQLQVLANDLYIIREKIIKTDALIKIVKEKSKRCNKLEKLHKKLLETHNQLQLKQSDSEIKLNYCFLHHTPLENKYNELKTRFANAEALHSDYVNTAELKYQNVCQELENLRKAQNDSLPKTKEKRNKKNARGLTKEELASKFDDLTIEFELTKSELENVNKDLIEKDKIINKYEFEKQMLNDTIKLLNNKLNKKEIIQCDNKSMNEIPLIENDFIMDVLPAIAELDNSLPILSDSMCADIVKSEEKDFFSFGVQTDDLLSNNKYKNEIKTRCFGVQTDVIEKSFHSLGCQTNIKTNCVQLQTDDDIWVKHVEYLRRDKLKTSSSQTYYDDIINVEDVLLEMTADYPLLSPLSPMSLDETEDDLIANKSNSISVGPDEIIPTFANLHCQTDEIPKINCFTQTLNTNEQKTNSQDSPKIDSVCQTDKIKLIESNTQTEFFRKIDGATQTCNESLKIKSFNNDLLLPNNMKTPQRFWETKLKNKLNTPNSKISKKYKTTKNKLLEQLKLSNLDCKQILEKYLSEGNGPTLFVSPKLLKSSQLNMYNPCKHQNPFMNISNRPLYKQCHSNLHECPCFHSCNMQRNYPPCTTLQCNISCNGCVGYCNHSHRIRIKHNSKAVILSSDSESEEYQIRNYYKNKFKNKYKAKRICKCKDFTNENFYNRLNTLKREAKTSDTDASIDVCKVRKRRRKFVIPSSDSDESSNENINTNTCRDKHKKHKFKNPINQIAQEKISNNLRVTTDKLIVGTSQNNSKVCDDIQPIQMEQNIENEESKTNNNCDNLLNNVNTRNTAKNVLTGNKNDKNIAKPVKEKTTKIKRLRKLLNKTPLNYNKSNILTRSMSKNIQEDTNKINKINSKKPELDLFGSLSDTSLNSDNENVNKNIQTRNNQKKSPNKTPINISPAKNQLKNKISPSLKIPRKLEIISPLNHVYKRPERRQTVPIGPLSPEPVNIEIVQPKIIPLEQISNTTELNLNSSEKCTNSNFAPEEPQQKTSDIITEIIHSSVMNTKAIKQSNNNNSNATACSSKQDKSQLQEKRFATKMISDVATMDWDKNLMNTVVEYLVDQDALVVAKLIVNEASIDRSEQLDKSFTPPAPLMTPSQQKILVLINRLDSEGLAGLKNKVIVLTEKRILSEKYLTNILGLTRIYVALCKIQYDIEGVRMFCCNAAYYLGDLFLPIMFIILTMWGDVLPMASADVPLAVTLVQVIQNKTCNTPGYNASTLNRLLTDCYEYKRGEITNDQVMDKLVACFIENPCNSIFTSILILCKNLPSVWRLHQIKKHFIPLVDKYRIDSSKSKLVSITLTLINRIKDMFATVNDKEYINELDNFIANYSTNISNNNC